MHLLGALVGEVIRERGGNELFDRVEAARLAGIGHREGDPRAEATLLRVVAALPGPEAEALVRAFSTYFQVVNLAEKVHRIRRRRDYLRAADEPQPESLEDTIQRLAGAGKSLEEVLRLLEDLRVEPELGNPDGSVPLEVAPLFETVDDLERAPAVMRELLEDMRYRRHLETRAEP